MIASRPPLRKDLEIGRQEGGRVILVDRPLRQKHDVEEDLLGPIRASFEAGVPVDDASTAWLEARYLLASERAARVDAWVAARAKAASPAGGRAVAFLDGSRFACHGCGLCCKNSNPGPISEEERARILAREKELAPHVALPPGEWFRNREKLPDGQIAYLLARTENGDCVFLDAQNLCLVHKHLGIETKPTICRAFPLQVTQRPDVTFISIRPLCGTLARSRDDGQPLGEQVEWLRGTIERDPSPFTLPRLICVMGDIFVPYPLALALEQRALDFLGRAPTIELAHLAIRDLAFAMLATLRPSPDVPALDRAEKLVKTAGLEEIRDLCGDIEPLRSIAALRDVLKSILHVSPQYLSTRARDYPRAVVSRADDRFFVDIVKRLDGALAARFGCWPAHPEVGAEDVEEGKRAAAVRAPSEDPGVLDFLRQAESQLVASSRALASPLGLVHGYALLALEHFLVRAGARLVALRRGAARATREDWNESLVIVDRALGAMDFTTGGPLVVKTYADLFATDDLPA